MRHLYAKNLYKKISIACITFVLTFNSLAATTPLFLAQKASAAVEPLTVAASCTTGGVLLTLTATNTLGKSGLIWFHTPYGSSSEHGFEKDSTKIWTQNTGLASIPTGSVSADVVYLIGNTSYTANYPAFSCIPEAPSITTSPVYVNGAQSTAALSWSHPDPSNIASYDYRLFSNQTDAVNNTNAVFTGTSTATSATAPTGGTDTTLYWNVTARSTYGFTSPSSNVGSIIIDKTAPQPSLTTDQDVYGGNASTITANGGSNEAATSYHFALSGAGGIKAEYISNSPVWILPNINDKNIYPSGAYTVSLTVTDIAGNPSTIAATKSITIDNDGPIVTIDPIEDTVVGGTVTPHVTAADDRAPLSYLWRAADEANNTLISDPSTSEPTFSPTAAGTYTFYLAVTDNLGNTTEVPFTFTWQSILPIGNAEEDNTGQVVALPATSIPPAAITATIFNSTRPQVLGANAADTTPPAQDTGKTKSISTGAKKEKEIAAPASDSFAWYWILLLLAVVVATYYAYRNWKLGKESK